MARVVWAEPALTDLRGIHSFISRDSQRYAATVVERITAATDRLARQPHSGSRLVEFPDSPYRQVVEDPYRIVYRYDQPTEQVFILAVVHGSRNFPSAFSPGG